jgi:hypothetical protein
MATIDNLNENNMAGKQSAKGRLKFFQTAFAYYSDIFQR